MAAAGRDSRRPLMDALPPLPAPPLTPFDRRQFDYSDLAHWMTQMEQTIRRVRRTLGALTSPAACRRSLTNSTVGRTPAPSWDYVGGPATDRSAHDGRPDNCVAHRVLETLQARHWRPATRAHAANATATAVLSDRPFRPNCLLVRRGIRALAAEGG